MESIAQAVILAAGEGQRLRPFTALKPKVMIPIANKPILQYVVEALRKIGILDIIMVVGYRKEHVLDFFGSGKDFEVKIDYVVQKQQLGTAHALKQAEEHTGERFLVVPGDNIIDSDTIASLINAQGNSILVKHEERDISKYGVVMVENGVVSGIEEKSSSSLTNLVNTGIYAFTRKIFDFVREENDLPAALQNMVAEGIKVTPYEARGGWFDVVYPWDILTLNDLTLSKLPPSVGGTIERAVTLKGRVSVGKDTIIRSNSYIVGPVTIGENCEIGPNVCIFPSTSIGHNVSIAPFTEIRNSLIGSDTEIGPGCQIEDSIIDKACILKGRCHIRSGEAEIKIDGEHHQVEIGAMLGEGCHLEDCVMLDPGVKVGNHARIRAAKVIKENIPDKGLVL